MKDDNGSEGDDDDDDSNETNNSLSVLEIAAAHCDYIFPQRGASPDLIAQTYPYICKDYLCCIRSEVIPTLTEKWPVTVVDHHGRILNCEPNPGCVTVVDTSTVLSCTYSTVAMVKKHDYCDTAMHYPTSHQTLQNRQANCHGTGVEER